MYAEFVNIPKSLKWDFEFICGATGTRADDAATRVEAVRELVHEIARRKGVVTDFKVEIDPDPFASPAAAPTHLYVPAIWVVHRGDLSSKSNPKSRSEMAGNPEWTTALMEAISRIGFESDLEAPKGRLEKVTANEVWAAGQNLARLPTLDQRSLALYFIIGHELGHIHHKHGECYRRNRTWSVATGLLVFLVIAGVAGGLYPLLKNLPLKDLIGVYTTLGVTAIFTGSVSGIVQQGRYDRRDERQADEFSIAAGETRQDRELAAQGGQYLFETVMDSGRDARRDTCWKKLMFDKKGNVRAIWDREHPSYTERRGRMKK